MIDRTRKAHEREIVDDLRSAAEDALQAGRVTLTESLVEATTAEFLIVKLQPRDAMSAPFVAQLDDERHVTLYLGHHETMVECFGSDREWLRQTVRDYARAVAAGQYEEWVRFRDGTASGAIGRLCVGDQAIGIRYNTLMPASWARARWRHVRYRPW